MLAAECWLLLREEYILRAGLMQALAFGSPRRASSSISVLGPGQFPFRTGGNWRSERDSGQCPPERVPGSPWCGPEVPQFN